jgi:hypothetical protein
MDSLEEVPSNKDIMKYNCPQERANEPKQRPFEKGGAMPALQYKSDRKTHQNAVPAFLMPLCNALTNEKGVRGIEGS